MSNATDNAIDSVSYRLRLFIAFTGQSIRQFSVETGIPYRTLQDYLAGKRLPGAEHLARMNESGVDLNWLINPSLELTFAAQLFFQRPEVAESLSPLHWALALSHVDARARMKKLASIDADEYSKRFEEKFGRCLRATEATIVYEFYFVQSLKQASSLIEKIVSTDDTKFNLSDVVTLLSPVSSSDFDPLIENLFESRDVPQ